MTLAVDTAGGGGLTPSGPRPLQIVHERPSDLTELDGMLFEGSPDRSGDSDPVRTEWIRDAVGHHLDNSPYYRKLANAKGFEADMIGDVADLARVPLVSSSAFKNRFVSTGAADDVMMCRSSGTAGSHSVVPRDDRTLERFVGTIMFGMREFLGVRERRRLLVLGPTTEEAGDLWFSYVLSLGKLINDTEFFVRDGATQFNAFVAAVAAADEGTQPVVIGPPALVVDLLDHCERVGADVDLRDGYVLTAGGWKKRANESVDRLELAARLESRFGLNAGHVRDFFNMVELNTVVFECESGIKHLPPWLDVIVRRPGDMSVADDGETGVLTYLDPTALSYPAFVFSDDLGHVTRGVCSCGRAGRFLDLDRRIAGIEERGCALKMQRYADRIGGPP